MQPAAPRRRIAFAVSVAEHVGLALANLMLRSDLRQLSIRDPLTGLFNRRYMEETLQIEIRRAERKEHSIGVIMLDIDHFKTFNDRFGHAAGDELLQSLGTLIRTNLRAGDIACRYGGEEFVLILPEASEGAARQRAEDLRERAHRMEVRHLDTVLGPVSISLGVGMYPDHGRTPRPLLASADAALYRAKEGGRDRVVIAQPRRRTESAVKIRVADRSASSSKEIEAQEGTASPAPVSRKGQRRSLEAAAMVNETG